MTCHHTPAGPMLRTHHRDCDSADCGGCDPCPEVHCTARSRCIAHIGPTELTCPTCISKTRNDLTMIETLAALMLPEAIQRGVNSEAAVLAGPAADPEAWSWRKVAARQGAAWHVSLLEDDDEQHPLTVTGVWEMMIRADYGPDTQDRLTVSSAVAYLDRMLHRIANDPQQDFPQMAREIRKCRTHLEAVLHDSHAPETGAPCPECERKRLPCPVECDDLTCERYCHAGHLPRGERPHRKDDCPNHPARALTKTYDDEDTTGASDHWDCRTCGALWKEADYRHRVAVRYLEHATALTASQIETEYRVPQGTLRRWVVEGNVKRAGKDESGRQLYRVSDVRDMRDHAARVSADGLRARPHEDA